MDEREGQGRKKKMNELIVLGFNDMSTLCGSFCRLPEKGRKEIGDERKGQGRKMNRDERKATEEIKNIPLYLL